jgi:hypothetical protein
VRIALDAQGGFPWNPKGAPFPGLLAFREEDAAVYFGRDDDIRRLIERLEARRNQGGATIAGKIALPSARAWVNSAKHHLDASQFGV